MKLQFLTDNSTIREQVVAFIDSWESNLSYFESATSGSTGIPKRIKIDKKYAMASANATIKFLELHPGDKSLLCLNIATIGGKMMVVRSLLHSLELFVVEPSANPLKQIDDYFHFIAIAPIQLHTLLVESPEKLKKVSKIIVGGGAISNETIELLKQHQLTVYQTFGMTETISHIALRKVGFETEDIYSTLENITVSSENEQLIIEAPSIGCERLTTNDRVEIISNRQFRWIGRTDFVINTGGVKVQMEELERELETILHVPFFIYKMEDVKLVEKIVLILESDYDAKFTQKSTYSGIRNPYHVPKMIAFTTFFIRTTSDKIIRKSTFDSIDAASFIDIL